MIDKLQQAIINNARVNEKNFITLKEKDKAILDNLETYETQNTEEHTQLSQGVNEVNSRVDKEQNLPLKNQRVEI